MTVEISAAEFRGTIEPKSEKEFQGMVENVARAFGWRWYHTHDSRRSEKGFPDLFLVHPERHQSFWAELKVGRNKPTAEQEAWIAMLVNCRAVVFVWYPKHWDEIVDVLSGEIDL